MRFGGFSERPRFEFKPVSRGSRSPELTQLFDANCTRRSISREFPPFTAAAGRPVPKVGLSEWRSGECLAWRRPHPSGDGGPGSCRFLASKPETAARVQRRAQPCHSAPALGPRHVGLPWSRRASSTATYTDRVAAGCSGRGSPVTQRSLTMDYVRSPDHPPASRSRAAAASIVRRHG